MKIVSFLFFLSITFCSFGKSKVIAISYFDNTTSNSKYNSLSKGIADMLITDLSKVRDIEIVEREKLEELIKEIKLGKSSYFDQSTAQKLGKGLGAASILTGAFYVLDGVLRIDARLINVETGKIIAADEVTGSTSDFFSLHKKLVKLLIESLNISYNSKTESVIDYDNKIELTAVVNYSNAIAYEDNGLQENATEVLETTLKQYPEFLFAKTKLDKIKAFIAEREREREALMNVKLADFWKTFDPESETTNSEIMALLTNFISSYSYNSLLTFNNQLRKKGINTKAEAYKGSPATLGEYLDYYDCIALSSLKKHHQLIEPSKLFLSNYPTSSFFNAVKLNLNIAIQELEKTEEGKKNLKTSLSYNETYQYLNFLNSLGYYAYKRFISETTYPKFKKIYFQKIIKGDKNTLLLFVQNDEFDEVLEFFEIAEENLDRELMVQIKDLAIEICANSDYEESAYDLEEDIEDFDEEREKHKAEKQKLVEKLQSEDINKIAYAIQWLWTLRDNKEEQFVINESLKYIDLKDTREKDRVYTTRLRAYENIIESQNKLGNFAGIRSMIDQYSSDPFLLENKDRDFDAQTREFKKYLREGPKEYSQFEEDILNNDIKANILEGQADVYSKHFQYYDEITARKELLEKYTIKGEKKELQHYLLFFAYYNVGLFEEMHQCANEFNQLYPKSVYAEGVKMMTINSPK